jgi:hypothetical protein
MRAEWAGDKIPAFFARFIARAGPLMSRTLCHRSAFKTASIIPFRWFSNVAAIACSFQD